jgi:predicted ester cyclase
MSVSTVERSAESIVRSFWEDFWNRSDLATGKEIMTPHLYQRTVEYMKRVHAVFPDAHWIVEDMVTDGATVVTRYTWSGTQLGVMGGLAPTGKQVKMACIMFHHVKDGKLLDDEQGILDVLSFYQQLGVVPTELRWI